MNGDLTITNIQNIVGEDISQNRQKIIERGTVGMYQIEGTVNGMKYVIGFNNGRIGQLYSIIKLRLEELHGRD